MKNFFYKLIKSNTGVSSKSFFLVAVTLMGCILLCVVAFVLIWDVCEDGYVTTQLGGIAAVIGSITSLFAAAGATKCYGEKHEIHPPFKDQDTDAEQY